MGIIGHVEDAAVDADADADIDADIDIDIDIDFAIDDQEQSERRALELADRLRIVAAQDPELAQDLVDQLIVALDRALGGTFREHLDGFTRGVAERALTQSGNG